MNEGTQEILALLIVATTGAWVLKNLIKSFIPQKKVGKAACGACPSCEKD